MAAALTPAMFLRLLQSYNQHPSVAETAAALGLSAATVRYRLTKLGLILSPSNLRQPLSETNDSRFVRELQLRLNFQTTTAKWLRGSRTIPQGALVPRPGAALRLKVFEHYREYQNFPQLERDCGAKQSQVIAWLKNLGLVLPESNSNQLLDDLNDPKFLSELQRRLEAEARLEELITEIHAVSAASEGGG